MMTLICYGFFQPAWFIKKRERKVDTNFSIIIPQEFNNVISVIFFTHIKVALDMFYQYLSVVPAMLGLLIRLAPII